MLSNPPARQGSLLKEPARPAPAPRRLNLLGLFRTKTPQTIVSEPGVDHLQAFASESLSRSGLIRPAPLTTPAPITRRLSVSQLVATFVIAVLVSGVTIVMVRRLASPPSLAASAAATGKLTVATQPAGAEVVIDGESRGVTPLSLNIPSGSHTMTVRSAGTERVVPIAIAAGAEHNHYLEMNAPGAEAQSQSPVAKRKATVASRAASAAPATAGPPKIVQASNSNPNPNPPMFAKVSINVRPWADVFLDGRNVGQTPIGNLLIPIGTHELLFKHPDLGDRKQTVVVSATGPNRFTADFSK
jgi:hypothetical protein